VNTLHHYSQRWVNRRCRRAYRRWQAQVGVLVFKAYDGTWTVSTHKREPSATDGAWARMAWLYRESWRRYLARHEGDPRFVLSGLSRLNTTKVFCGESRG